MANAVISQTFRSILQALLLLAAGLASASGLTPLDDDQLSVVTGREGVAMDFVYAMNAYHEDSAGYTAGDPITDTNHLTGDPLASLENCDGLMNPCSLGITVNNRPGMWVMLKDLYGIQKINNFWLNGRETQAVSTVGSSVADENRFKDNGSCMLPGGNSRTPCLPDSPSLPSLAMSYGPAIPGGDDLDTFEVDVEWHLYIGRVTVQYDDPTNGLAYLPANDQPGSFMSYQITDMHQKAAKFDYDGRVVMFGW